MNLGSDGMTTAVPISPLHASFVPLLSFPDAVNLIHVGVCCCYMSSSMLESGEDTKKVKDPTSDLVSEQDAGVSILSGGAALSVSGQVLTVTAARKKHSSCCSVCAR